ncbi:peptide synthetase [Pseudoclavibacter sp. 13-3]|uniref:peptide synthetase n=1 Tax=Pseudoclavibacter sp. 13-3 TaxID=2901228 RepID=UPI001E3D5A91|nr:peptide synthetase [Pseudoclavibacter sp. 13-3]MCD7100778.1 peptide synthetase [Pseudoclavibacter sp. 13-3]
MRLTNITRVTLPAGHVRHYAVTIGDVVREHVPISFDQRRHVGEGDRPGSWMALAFRLPRHVTADQLGDAWVDVVRRHGTMRTVFSRMHNGALQLTEHAVSAGSWHEHPRSPGQLTRDAVREILDAHCRPLSRPSHRLVLIDPANDAADSAQTVVIGSDHSHVDMWSVLLLARDLLAALDPSAVHDDVLMRLETGRPAAPGTTDATAASTSPDEAPDFADHTAALAARPAATPEVLERWSEILAAGDGLLPTLAVDLGDLAHPVPEVVEVRDILDADRLELLSTQAAALGVRLLHMVLADLASVTLSMTGQPLRALFPVHSRYEPRWHDAVGWFVTNSVIECTSDDPRECRQDVQDALQLAATPLAGIFDPRGGMPAGPGMFAISWLDTRRLPVQLPADLATQYVSASLRVDGVMIWFVVSPTGLHLRCRYPDTPQARASMRAWLEAVVHRLQERTRHDAVEHRAS